MLLVGRFRAGTYPVHGAFYVAFAVGGASDHTFVDTLDLTRALGRREVGVSVDAYQSEGDLAWLVGPTVEWNDRLGAWALSMRFGDATEVRLTRTLTS